MTFECVLRRKSLRAACNHILFSYNIFELFDNCNFDHDAAQNGETARHYTFKTKFGHFIYFMTSVVSKQ